MAFVKDRLGNLGTSTSEKKTVGSFVCNQTKEIGIPFRSIEYLEECTGRILRGCKSGTINKARPPNVQSRCQENAYHET
ncbi:MAG: hypothetical protein ACI9SP_004090 [Arenicella sp.]|jgi:hypothetical protein